MPERIQTLSEVLKVQRVPLVTQLPPGISKEVVDRHVIRPRHLEGIEIEEVEPRPGARFRFRVPPPPKPAPTPRADLGLLGSSLHDVLKDRVAGYCLLVNQNGKRVHTGIWDWARKPADGGKGWTEGTRMHVASVSKWLTAVGTVAALDSRGVSLDTSISGYLPAHWKQGPNIKKITFRHLLTHTSGIEVPGSATDYATMKAEIAAGVSGVGQYQYENTNFALCRVLVPILLGSLSRTTTWIPIAALNDVIWDVVTISQFRSWMQQQVFTPAGVSGVGFSSGTGTRALAYATGGSKGWDSGDLAAVAGGAGFRLSPDEVLRVMDSVRRRGKVLPATRAQEMLDGNLGVDGRVQTTLGPAYHKNGRWTSDSRTEQCVAFFLPGDQELTLFVNSPIRKAGDAEDLFLRSLVADAYQASIA